ncbi:MAG: thiamine phosphate synthase [Acidobacteriota bacterium]
MAANRPPRLLAIAGHETLGSDHLGDWIGQLHVAGVDALQIRAKLLDDRALESLARSVVGAVAGRLRVLVNGRADIATAVGADGVHLPSHGVRPGAVRRRFPDLLLGLSTHHADDIEEAGAAVDYVTFGPVFDTPSKRAFGDPVGPGALRRAARHGVPILALGGIDAAAVPTVAAAGASGAAAIRALQDKASLVQMGAAAARAWPRPPAKDR